MSWVSLSSDGDSGGQDYKKVAKEAFSSPTTLGAKLGSRSSKDGVSVGSSGSSSSRRAPSLVQSEEEADDFKEMLSSTQVVVPKSQAQSSQQKSSDSEKGSEHSSANNNSTRSNNNNSISASGRSRQTAAGVASVRSKADPPESAHSRQSVSSISESVAKNAHEVKAREHSSSRPPPAQGSSRNARVINGTSHSRPPAAAAAGQQSQVSGTSSASSTSELNSMNSGSAGRKDLDLLHNDNSFHVIGGLIVEFFHSKQQPGSSQVKLTMKDLAQLDRLAPPRVRSSFVEAVRHRFTNAPIDSNSAVHALARQCHELGLDAEGDRNPLLIAADAAIQLVIPIPSGTASAPGESAKHPAVVGSEHQRSVASKSTSVAALSMSGDSSKHSPAVGSEHHKSVASKSTTAAASNHKSERSEATRSSNYYEESESGAHGKNSATTSKSPQPDEAPASKAPAMASKNDTSYRSATTKRSNYDDSETMTSNNCASSTGKNEQSSYTDHSVTGTSVAGSSTGQNKLSVPTSGVEVNTSESPVLEKQAGTEIAASAKRDTNVQTTPMDFASAISAAFSDLKSMATSMGRSNAAVPATMDMPSVSDTDDDSNKVGMRAALLSNLSSRMDESSYVPNVTSGDEGIAKQQLLAELQEASNLMAESKTQEAAKFWRDHVVELQARLRALNADDASTVTSAPQKSYLSSVGGMSRGNQSSVGGASLSHADVSKAGQSQSQSEVFLNANFSSSKMTSGSLDRYQPPAFRDEGDSGKASWGAGVRSGKMERSAASTTPPNIDPSLEGVPMVDVVSPADLPGGYHFEAEIEGRRFLATVPAGGVQKGETFSCYMRDLDKIGAGVPVGRWRDGLFDCCSTGCCHPVIWNALFCPLILLQQIMTRVGFDFLGRPATKRTVNGPKTLMTILGFWIFVNIGLFCAYNLKWSQGMGLSMADLGALAFVNVAYIFFLVYLTSSTRGSLREKYYIRESRFHDLEDCCCATFCLPCSVCQMARHTADYTEHEGVCCNDTGLPDCYRMEVPPRSPKHVV